MWSQVSQVDTLTLHLAKRRALRCVWVAALCNVPAAALTVPLPEPDKGKKKEAAAPLKIIPINK